MTQEAMLMPQSTAVAALDRKESFGSMPGLAEVAGASDNMQDPFYSPENIALLKRRIANLEAGGGIYRDIIEVDDEEDLGD